MPILKSAKYELFCRQYVRHGNATLAATEVGYSAKTAKQYGHELLQKPDLQARISEIRQETEENLGFDRDMCNAHLAAMAFSNVDDFMSFTSDGDVWLDIGKSSRIQRASISKVRVDDYLDGRGEDARDVKRVEIQMHGKLPALVKLMEAHGWLKPDNSDNDLMAEVMRFVRNINSPDAPFSGLTDDDVSDG